MNKLPVLTAATLLAISLAGFAPVSAQGQINPQDLKMTVYKVVRANDGRQYYMDNYGRPVALPGSGVGNNNTVAIYTGNLNNDWYVDTSGKPQIVNMRTPVDPAQVQAMFKAEHLAAPTTTGSTSSSSNSNSSGSALGRGLTTAAGVATGVAVGNAISNNDNYYNGAYYHGIPYGQPVYRNNNGQMYYNTGGNTVNVNTTQQNSAYVNQFNNQHAAVNSNNGSVQAGRFAGRRGAEAAGTAAAGEGATQTGRFGRRNAGNAAEAGDGGNMFADHRNGGDVDNLGGQAGQNGGGRFAGRRGEGAGASDAGTGEQAGRFAGRNAGGRQAPAQGARGGLRGNR